MRTFTSRLIGLLVALFSFFPGGAAATQPPSLANACTIDKGLAKVLMRGMSDIREVTVIAPDGGVLYLYSPARGVYHLNTPRSASLDIDPRTQMGAQYADDGKLHERTVFDDTGPYRIVVLGKASNPAPNVPFARVACAVDYAASGELRTAEVVSNLGRDLASVIASCPVAQGAGIMPACRDSGSCQTGGHGYCCSNREAGGPCYCNNCCVAAKTSTLGQ